MPRAKLTDKFLQSSKRIVPAAGQTDYWDQLTPGFGVRVSYGGRKSFQVLARINGKLQRFTLGAYPRLSLAEARDQAERMLKDAAKGISPKDRELEERHKAQAQRRNSSAKSQPSSWMITPRGCALATRCSECSIGSCCQPGPTGRSLRSLELRSKHCSGQRRRWRRSPPTGLHR